MGDYHGGGGGGYMAQNDMDGGASQERGGGGGGGGGPSPPRRMRENKTLLPVTIKQLLTAHATPDDMFKIDGAEAVDVTFIALIRSLSVQAATVNYVLDDGTGVLDGMEWKPQDETAEQQQQRALRGENVYVRVVGKLRQNKDRRNVAIHHIRTVEDFNEITYHYLEAIQSHLYYTRGGATRAAAGGAAAPAYGGAAAGAGPSGYGAPITGAGGAAAPPFRAAAPQHAMTGNAGQPGLPVGLKVNEGRVLTAIMQEKSDVGAHVEAVAQKLNLSIGEVRKIVEFLSDEGHIFSTTDEHHYKSTD